MLEKKNQDNKIPSVSVIIPSLDGSRDGNVPKLLDDLSKQTIQPLDIHVVKGVKPNGLARNVGVKEAKGDVLVFLDDDIRLGHEHIIENLIFPLIDDNSMGMTGASIQIPEDSSWFQKATARQTERNEFPVVDKITESDMVLT
ncbi:glycosyltransferase, partial [Candidatus Poribacteria bacterium]|nr:glycosyltransferase [Candidatus Poribacteria bacterium]